MDNDPDFEPIQDSDFQAQQNPVIDITPKDRSLSGFKDLVARLQASGEWGRLTPDVQRQLMSHTGQMYSRETAQPLSADDLANAVSSSNPVGGMGGKAAKKLGGWVAEKTGLARIPDYLMQTAAGVKKYAKGMGNEMIDQGLWGFRGQMGKQAEKKIPELAKQLQSEVANLPPSAQISHPELARDVLNKAERFTPPSGQIPSADLPSVEAIKARANEIAGRVSSDPLEGLALKKQAGARGWRRDLPTAGLENELNRAETVGYGKQLENLYSEANPGMPNKVTDLNRAQEALFKAKRGADRPADLHSLIGLLRGGSMPVSPALSLSAQALQKGAKGGAGLTGLLMPGAAQRLQNPRYLPNQEADPDFEPIE